MQKRTTFFPIFIIFLLLAGIVFFFARNGAFAGLTGFFERVTTPLQRATFGIFHPTGKQSEEDKLREENAKLLTQLAKQKELEKENRALHDQFEVSTPTPKELLPAQIIGRSTDQVILDKGSADGVTTGDIIVVKDNLVGRVTKASSHVSVVHLITHSEISFTGQDSKTDALGVVVGRGGNAIVFGNVVLSDKLEKDDLIVTKGDVDEHGQGYPADLVVGKVTAVYKQASALFQSAEVRSLVDFSKLSTVFVITKN